LQLEQQQHRSFHPVTHFPLRDEIMKDSNCITTNQMFRLHHHVKNLVRHLSLVETQWIETVDHAINVEKELVLHSSRKKQYYLVCALLASILSLFLVIGEIMIAVSTDNNNPLSFIVNKVQGNSVAKQIFTVVPLLYFTVCAYYPLFHLRCLNLYFIGRHRTDEGTLLFNATLLLRISTALAYNFVLLLKIPASSLQNFIGVIDTIPFFGGSFTTIFPIFILLINMLVFFNIFQRIAIYLNISNHFTFVTSIQTLDSNEDIALQIREGKSLIRHELQRRI
jgi:hypothetical protein